MKPIWNKLNILRGLTGSPRVLHAELRHPASRPVDEVEMSRRWARARQSNPELLGDVIRLGGLMVAQPMQDGEVMPLDPYRMAYEAGRRDLALQLSAMMALSVSDLNDLMEDADA